MKKILLHFIFLFVCAILSYSQSATLTIQNVEPCNNSGIIIPVYVEDLYNAGAITLFIGFDTSMLDFSSVENIHQQLSGLLYNEMTLPTPQIGISWTGINGANIQSGKMFDLVFYYHEGLTELNFNSGCEIANVDLELIPIDYIDGIVQPKIQIDTQPLDQNVVEGSQVIFSISSSGWNSIQWQISNDDGVNFNDLENSTTFQGTNTQTLEIYNTPLEFNNNLFRCKMINMDCQLVSETALLTVEELLFQQFQLNQGWNSFSTFINIGNIGIEELFDPIIDNVEFLSDGTGVFYPSGQINTLGLFNQNKGYILKLNNSSMLSFSGPVVTSGNIVVPEGWSYLPIIKSCNLSITEVIAANPDIPFVIIEIAGMGVFWPDKGIYSLETLETGKSYMIYLEEEHVFFFPECK